MRRRSAALLVTAALGVGGCSSTSDSAPPVAPAAPAAPASSSPAPSTPPPSAPVAEPPDEPAPLPAFKPTLYGVVLLQVTLMVVLAFTAVVNTPWDWPKSSGLAATMQLATIFIDTSKVALLVPLVYVAAIPAVGASREVAINNTARRLNLVQNMITSQNRGRVVPDTTRGSHGPGDGLRGAQAWTVAVRRACQRRGRGRCRHIRDLAGTKDQYCFGPIFC